MFRLITLTSFLILAACAGPGGMLGPGTFEVEEADTRFSESDSRVLVGKNNRISTKSIAGGVHIDGYGMYINPVLVIARDGGSIEHLGLSLQNVSSYSTRVGSPNSLGNLERLIFLIDGDQVLSKDIEDQSYDWSDQVIYNSVTQSASAVISESGSVAIRPEELERILSASSVAVRIEGSRRSMVYEAKDISRSFLENLRRFNEDHVRQR